MSESADSMPTRRRSRGLEWPLSANLWEGQLTLSPISSGVETSTFQIEDLQRIPQIELRILIQALQKGLRAEDALKSPAFHSTVKKLEIILVLVIQFY